MARIFNQTRQTDKRRQLRRRSTRAEKLLWQGLRDRRLDGFKFCRQYSVRAFVLDFYCPELKLAIEVDGSSHDSESAKRYDAERQSKIEAYGIRFLRFTNDEVFGNGELVLKTIREEIKRIQPQS